MAKKPGLGYDWAVFKLKILSRRSRLVYAASPLGRLLYAALLGLLIWGFSTQGGPFSAVAIVLAAICLLGVLYVEVWVFDKERGVATSYFGVAPWIRRSVYPFSDIDRLAISHFIKGVAPAEEERPSQAAGGDSPAKRRRLGRKPMLTFALHLKSGAAVPIEIIEEGRSAGRTEADAREIAAYANLELVFDRPSDSGPVLSVSDIPRGFDKR